MPLPKPAPRKHLHTREIVCRGYQRDDGLWDIEGTITDTKTYSFDNHDRDGVVAGEPIHRMSVRLTVDESLTVRTAHAVTENSPYHVCGEAAPAYGSLAGLTIGPGWRKAVFAKVGGTGGCTHVTDLLTGPLAVTAFQTVAPARARRAEATTDEKKPAVLDTCYALASTSPVVKRRWPKFYAGG